MLPGHDPVRNMVPLFPGTLDTNCILHRVLMVPRVTVELLVILDSRVLRVSQGRSVLLAR